MEYAKPLPRINGDNQPFWEGCRHHELRFQKCAACGHVRFPPSLVCPQCLGRQVEWVVAVGTGKVYTFAVYHVAFHEAFRQDLPYVVAVVALDEGPRLLTNIVGCTPDQVRCDMPVVVAWRDVTDQISLPLFAPA